MSRSPRSEVEFRYTPSLSEDLVTTLAAAHPDLVAAGLAVRTLGSDAGMQHYPGWWWSATAGDLIAREPIRAGPGDAGRLRPGRARDRQPANRSESPATSRTQPAGLSRDHLRDALALRTSP